MSWFSRAWDCALTMVSSSLSPRNTTPQGHSITLAGSAFTVPPRFATRNGAIMNVRGWRKVGGRLRIYLTGRMAVEAEGQILDESAFPGRQGRLAFAFLALSAQRPVARDALADSIWNDALPA